MRALELPVPLSSMLSSRLAVRHAEKGACSISCLVWSILQLYMLAFLAETSGQILFPRQILFILQSEKVRV